MPSWCAFLYLLPGLLLVATVARKDCEDGEKLDLHDILFYVIALFIWPTFFTGAILNSFKNLWWLCSSRLK